MKLSNKQYLLQFAALSSVVAFLGIVCQFWLKPMFIGAYFWHTFLFLNIIMLVSHFIFKLGIGKTPYEIQSFFMLSSSVKLFLSMLTLFLYFYFIKENMKVFVFNFFILYFTYTFFEIKTLLLSLHPDSKADQNK